MNLEVGKTTQTEVLEVFGALNITSIDGSGQEVWTYQRHATVSQSKSRSGYFTVILAGGGGGRSSSQQSTRTITLIIKFDKDGVVSDFASRTGNFSRGKHEIDDNSTRCGADNRLRRKLRSTKDGPRASVHPTT